MSFFFFFLSFSFKLRERERGYTKFGYKEKWSQSLLIFFLWWSSCEESFFFYELIDFILFLTLTWRKWLLRVSQNFFVFFYPEYLALVLSPTNPVQQLTFLIFYFRWWEGVPTSVLGSQPIVWLLPSSFQCQATQVRSPSINIYGSPLCDLHSFLTVTLW